MVNVTLSVENARLREENKRLSSNDLWAYSFNDGEHWEWDESCTSRDRAINNAIAYDNEKDFCTARIFSDVEYHDTQGENVSKNPVEI